MKKYIVSCLLLLGTITPVISFAQGLPGDVDPNAGTSSCVSISTNLGYRSRDINTNGAVSTLQDFLQAKGYLNTEPTGYFGILTRVAVASFQISNGINPSGYVGPITRAKLEAVTCVGAVNTVNFPSGCISNSGYSSTTGESCITSQPYITITSPTPGTTVIGSPFFVSGTCFNYKGNVSVYYYSTKKISKSVSCRNNKWKTNINLETNASSGSFTLYAELKGGQQATVNLPFFINSPTFTNGCTSDLGYSYLTGESCRVSNNNSSSVLESLNIIKDLAVSAQQQTGERLQDITGHDCSDCACRTGDPLFVDEKSCYQNWISALNNLKNSAHRNDINISDLYRDSWGSPFLLDENEQEAGPLDCRNDTLISAGPNGVYELGKGDDVVFKIPFSKPCPTDSTQPSITVINPNGGQVYTRNDIIPIEWSSVNVPKDTNLFIRLRNYDTQQEYILIGGTDNDGSESVPVSYTVPAGPYTLEIKSYLGNILLFDQSDSYFKIED